MIKFIKYLAGQRRLKQQERVLKLLHDDLIDLQRRYEEAHAEAEAIRNAYNNGIRDYTHWHKLKPLNEAIQELQLSIKSVQCDIHNHRLAYLTNGQEI